MKNFFLNQLIIKREENNCMFLSNHLYSICDCCGCKFLFLSNNINIYCEKNTNEIFCGFCLKHNNKYSSVFFFSFSKIYELLGNNNKREIKNIIKNIYFIGNNYPFLSYNSDADYWALNIDHKSLNDSKEELIRKSISEMFDAFKSLNNHIYLNLKCMKKDLLEEIEIFLQTRNTKSKMFKGSCFF